MSISAANDSCTLTRRLFVKDPSSGKQYLIDSGADLSVYPRLYMTGPLKRTSFNLAAANGSIIHTYGYTTLSLNLGLKRCFPWKFVIADVAKPIIGADFISHYELLIDLKNKRLIDTKTGVMVNSEVHTSNSPTVKIISTSFPEPYSNLIKKFPNIIRPNGGDNRLDMEVRHFIRTTPGQPGVFKTS